MSAVDVLLALDVRVDGVHLRGDGVARGILHLDGKGLLEDGPHDERVEHGDAFFIFHESATSHDADHGRRCPAVFLVGCEQGRHDGG